MMQGGGMRIFGVDISINGVTTRNADGGGGAAVAATSPLLGVQISHTTYNHKDHVPNRPKMVNNNSEPRRKRERSLSPSASTATATNITGANSSKNKLNTNRRSQPRKEKICKANTTRPMILPQRIRQKMRELGIDVDDKKSKPELILQKLVFKSDIDNQQARFLIPKGQLSTSDDDFLEHDEWRVLNEGTGKINVKVIQETMEVKDMKRTLARWEKLKKKPREIKRNPSSYALQKFDRTKQGKRKN
ncbi:LOW QUALITY PROTEIN: hypothetical protein Cgig2_000941 [Carnegiea gigantea]|uniref:Uncharacterized protein n=1 Tax=Carnegiea gigantea TaxID=171969 RepID=A0A9Q1QLH7_9CARY|nr:LOW QUALITY PROTEIN: hypothetical protein Cgig2_000941 [Carnegiea gigantea]